MEEEMYDDTYYNDEFNNEWDSEKEEWDEITYEQESNEQESFDNLPDWIDDVEDPENMEEFNFDDNVEDDM